MAETQTDTKDKAGSAAQVAQFKRDLSHILIQETAEGDAPLGPLIVIGPYDLQFKVKSPVSALAALVGGENRIEAMRDYVRLSLEGDTAPFEELLGRIDIDGLGEIIGTLGEGYTSFPEKS